MDRLPVELLHRIFDHLDTETIVFSVRSVCNLFRSVVHTYDRYVLDYRSISKRNFFLLSQLIHPKKILSLILSNDRTTSNQIALFISFDHFNQFTRLRSLTLLHIDEDQLQLILQQANLHQLQSFSVSIREYDDNYIDTTPILLASLFSQSNLRIIDLNINNERFSKMIWPINFSIHCLTIHGKITLINLLQILQSSSHLQQLNLSEFPSEIPEYILPTSFQQLLFLSIHDVRKTIDELERFLLFTPSLVYLKLIGGKMMMNGQRWEEFISKNLFYLKKFEFYFTQWELIKQTERDLYLILNSFQTPFWIEEKQWFVTCKYDPTLTGTIYLYSIPICRSYFIYEKGLKTISFSTCVNQGKNNLFLMDNINSLDLILNKSLANDIEEKKTTINNPLFPEVNEINLEFYEQWPLFSLQTLSILIDINRIVRLTLHSNYFNDYNDNIWIDIRNFLQQASNLSDLFIQSSFDTYHSDKTIENLSLILPYHIKHLELSIQNLKQIQIILSHCRNLSTMTLNNYETKLYEQMLEWFEKNTIHSTCRISHGMVSVWLGKRTI